MARAHGIRTGSAGLAAVIVSVAALALSAAEASAAEPVDRVVEDGWQLIDGPGVVDVVKDDGGTYMGIVQVGNNDCFPRGTVAFEFSGSEPFYAGTEYYAVTSGGLCTGDFEARPADFFVSWDAEKIHFGVTSGGDAGNYEKTRVDTDRDGLFDDEEISGVNTYADEIRGQDPKIEVNLPAMGADPMRRDVFVEIDHMPGYDVDPEAVEVIERRFDDAQVGNPDGSQGISLHIDAGPDSIMNIRSGESWGDLSMSDAVPFSNVLGSAGPDGEYDWSEFLEYKGEHLLDERGLVFHYAITAPYHAFRDVGGESMGIPAGNFMVAFQCPGVRTRCNVDSLDQAALIMHELGHNLGLRHGGDDDVNRKPNHFSVMNYSYSTGVPLAGTDNFYFGYSFVGPSDVPDLNEHALNEHAGVGSSLSGALAIFYCARGSRLRTVEINHPADFDCDGSARGTVSTDINDDGEKGTLSTANEWDLITLDRNFFAGGPTVPSFDAAAAQSSAGSSQAPGTPPFTLTDTTLPSVESPGFFDTRPALLGDRRKPKLRVSRSRHGRRVVLRARASDKKQLARLIVDLGAPVKRHIEREPKRRHRSVSMRVAVPRGTRVGVVALDSAGNARERRFVAR